MVFEFDYHSLKDFHMFLIFLTSLFHNLKHGNQTDQHFFHFIPLIRYF